MRSNILRVLIYTASVCFILGQLIPYTVIDPELKPYNDEYLILIHKYCKENQYYHPIQQTMYFQDMDYNNIAYCSYNGVTNLKVVYNRKNWNHQTEAQRYSSMMHELSHCYLGAEHSKDITNFMYAYEEFLPKEVVTAQMETLIKDHCK